MPPIFANAQCPQQPTDAPHTITPIHWHCDFYPDTTKKETEYIHHAWSDNELLPQGHTPETRQQVTTMQIQCMAQRLKHLMSWRYILSMWPLYGAPTNKTNPQSFCKINTKH